MYPNKHALQGVALLLAAALLVPWGMAQSSSPEFYAAIRANDLGALRALIGAGRFDNPDSRGRTPLMQAAAAGSIEAMRLLVSAGARVNAADNSGITPLMFGVRDLDKVRFLLDRGADSTAKSSQGQTALLIAASTAGSTEVVRALVAKGADPKGTGPGGRSGLVLAAGANDAAMVRFFLDQGADVNAAYRTDKDGYTALMAASAQANTAVARLLLSKGADANRTTSNPGAVKNGRLGLSGLTALMMAVPYGTPDLVRALLDGGANVNAADVRGLTPLMLSVASENQDPAVVKILLSAGADAAAKSVDGESALDWARKYGNPEVLALLKGVPAGPAAAAEGAVTPSGDQLRTMVRESTALLQRTTKQFAVDGGCAGCHHQHFTAMLLPAVRAKGIEVDEKAAAEVTQGLIDSLRARQTGMALRLDGPGIMAGTLYTASMLQAVKYPADEFTDSLAVFLMSRQFTDGRWPREDESRSPLDDGDINRAALSAAAIHSYAPPSLKAEAAEHLSRIREWMLRAKPRNTDDRAMLLYGLSHTGAAAKEMEAASKALLGLQRPDGGWSPNPHLQSDAYATGQALWVLLETGSLKPADTAYRRGVQFLVNTRQNDGSWHVRSRAPKFQPYFESGFPHEHDQWVSSAATARAVLALTSAIP